MEGYSMGRTATGRRKARSAASRRQASADRDRIHTLGDESNIGIADDPQIEIDCQSARQRIEEYEMRRRLWARVHWLETFDPESRS
jgi:hypothetical protein